MKKINERIIKTVITLIMIITIVPSLAYAYDLECYYMDNNGDNRATVKITWGSTRNDDTVDVKIVKFRNSFSNEDENGKGIINWTKDQEDYGAKASKLHGKKDTSGKTCPSNLVLTRDTWGFDTWGVRGFNDESSALAWNNKTNGKESSGILGIGGYRIQDQIVKNVSKEAYDGSFKRNEKTGVDEPVTCETLFGDKNDKSSLRYMIDRVMLYVRIIVPILVIVLGAIDLGKAVLAGKEDNMKKAQATFIKRVIIGVCVFLIPVLVDLIMYIADIAWKGIGYTSCGL